MEPGSPLTCACDASVRSGPPSRWVSRWSGGAVPTRGRRGRVRQTGATGSSHFEAHLPEIPISHASGHEKFSRIFSDIPRSFGAPRKSSRCNKTDPVNYPLCRDIADIYHDDDRHHRFLLVRSSGLRLLLPPLMRPMSQGRPGEPGRGVIPSSGAPVSQAGFHGDLARRRSRRRRR